jgi:hypothetical protein
MATPGKANLVIYQGSTFNEILRWESSTKIYKPITAITQAAPINITAVGHNIPEGWRVRVTSVNGMKEINHAADVYSNATVKTVDIIELNNINSLGYAAYTTGGVIEYNSPVDLTGYTARMQVRAKLADTTTLLEITTANSGIIIDNTLKTIALNVSATDTAALTWTTGVYSLELVSALGVVSTLLTGNITVKQEITR